MSKSSWFLVRAGLFFVRVGVLLKGLCLAIGSAMIAILRPVGRWCLHVFAPFYGKLFLLQKRSQGAFRPVKHRVMFVVSNRFSVYVVVLFITILAGSANIQVATVRAEADVIGQRSILYALATQERLEFIDEYIDPTQTEELIPSSSLRASGVLMSDEGGNTTTVTATTLPVSAQVLRADGAFALAQDVGSETSSSTITFVPKRTETISYTIEPGDSLSTIAKKFGISLNTILWANNLTVRSVLRPGSTLVILPVSGVEHTVKSGDTVLAISKRYGIDAAEIVSYNNLEDSSALKIGQDLIIPGGEITATVTRPTATVAVKDIFTAPPAASQGQTKPAAGASMAWPTDGHYIVRGLSWYHTGMDIDCDGHKDGTSTNDNYAAADGVVQFSGSKRGYGLAVEVNHGNGLITRYGHFHSLYVQVGDTVTTGTPLGRCGSTGNSSGTHLHFEVIDAATKKFLNPANYIR